MIQADVEITVPFFDMDVLGIVWHGHYCKYLEIARCALLDKLDYGYNTMLNTGYIWPIVDLQCRYVKPAKFEQRINISAELIEWEYRMKIKYRITDIETNDVLAKATTIQAAVNHSTGELCYVSPEVFLNKLKAYHEGVNKIHV